MGAESVIDVYNPGDRVVIAAKRKAEGRIIHVTRNVYDDWAGSTVTIKETLFHRGRPYYRVEEMKYVIDNSMIDDLATEFSADEDDEIESASFGEFFSGYTIKHS